MSRQLNESRSTKRLVAEAATKRRKRGVRGKSLCVHPCFPWELLKDIFLTMRKTVELDQLDETRVRRYSASKKGADMSTDPLLDIATEEDIKKAQASEENVDLAKSYGQFVWASLGVGAIVLLAFAVRWIFF